jgi:hypothetical protein
MQPTQLAKSALDILTAPSALKSSKAIAQHWSDTRNFINYERRVSGAQKAGMSIALGELSHREL